MDSKTPDEHVKQYQEIIQTQKDFCQKCGVEWYPSPPDMKIGIAKDIGNGIMPINGLRHPPEKGTAGWFIWAGEYSADADFFQPMHVVHLSEEFPLVLSYLGLPPGWRFQIDDKGYEDVWEDKSLLDI